MHTSIRFTFTVTLLALLTGCDSMNPLDFGRSSSETGYRPEPQPFFEEGEGRQQRYEPDRRRDQRDQRGADPSSQPRSTPSPDPAPQPETTPTPRPTPTPSFLPTPALRSTPAPAAGGGSEEVRYGVPVPGKPGYVTSPYSPDAGYVDVTGLAPGTKAQDPYSGKVFLVP